MAMKRTDVIISGGGMVGLTLALALGQGGLEVVVVDTMPKAEILVPAFDGRVSALAYAVGAGFIPVRLGRRILRTETASIAALAAVQTLWGDFRC